MITIQGFAKLCGCNTQTLRYYDRIGLLTPAKVDPWTGYRYYEEEQAVQFVKIKNLQQADFSIEEIKNLLGKNDVLLMEAFEEKIREQELKLDARGFEGWQFTEHIEMFTDDPEAQNTWDRPDRILPVRNTETKAEKGVVTARLKKESWNVLRFKK